MQLYIEILKAIGSKLKGQENGIVLKKFCENMGITYIKIGQILSTQNYGNLFTEKDRELLKGICDDCPKISFEEIKEILEEEYKGNFDDIFLSIEEESVGSASISQVHKAVLKNGDIVAVKVKRRDITSTIEKDIEQMRKLIHRFGGIFKLKNSIGGDKALDLYLKWIYEETDFRQEIENIKRYQDFASSVNGQLEGVKDIKVPKLYEDYCTENVIVMEYIDSKTISKMLLNEENKEKIATGLNSYLKSNFYALFHDGKIVFHGDPHEGNIYIDSDGNIGFLDMGLVFELSYKDRELIKEFFLNAYSGNYDNLYQTLVSYGDMNDEQKSKFRQDIKTYCQEVKTKDVTCYFTDMINVCLKYEFSPPDFLFCMSKSFVCLNGINGFSENFTDAKELLQEQTIEYLIKRSLKDVEGFTIETLKVVPDFFENTCRYGLVKSLAKTISKAEEWDHSLTTLIDHYKEMKEIINPSGNNSYFSTKGKTKRK